MARYLIPVGLFALLVILLGVGLKLDPREVPSPLIGQAAPQFTLPALHTPEMTIGPQDMRGKVWMLNVWASWCVACRAEHPLLVQLARSGEIDIIGLNYKDENQAAVRWLLQHGDPYMVSAVDADGRVGIDWGVYGVPETFVIDQDGVIRYKHIGPITEQALAQKIMPLVRELRGSPA
jgi:cytochrome c biogenesis protein CcmG/thiol:disulfide interchange protein DsbE